MRLLKAHTKKYNKTKCRKLPNLPKNHNQTSKPKKKRFQKAAREHKTLLACTNFFHSRKKTE